MIRRGRLRDPGGGASRLGREKEVIDPLHGGVGGKRERVPGPARRPDVRKTSREDLRVNLGLRLGVQVAADQGRVERLRRVQQMGDLLPPSRVVA